MQSGHFINSIINDHIISLRLMQKDISPKIQIAVQWIIETLNCGNKNLLAVNGGSTGDAQHLTAEFIGRFHKERPSLLAIALTADMSISTAVDNIMDLIRYSPVKLKH